jgi:hypothetical protein
MSPHEFSKVMKNPYFASKHYREETVAGQTEAKIENFLSRIKNKVMFWKRNNNA